MLAIADRKLTIETLAMIGRMLLLFLRCYFTYAATQEGMGVMQSRLPQR
jgi:hypothetical protein